jgi:hypothetical protein
MIRAPWRISRVGIGMDEQRLGLRQRDDLESDGYDGSNRASAGRHNPGIDDELHLPCFVIEGRLTARASMRDREVP